MIKLKPCPFCGEKEDISLKYKMYHGAPLTVNGSKFWFVECLPCDARTGDCFDLDAPILGYKDGKEMRELKLRRITSKDEQNRMFVFISNTKKLSNQRDN